MDKTLPFGFASAFAFWGEDECLDIRLRLVLVEVFCRFPVVVPSPFLARPTVATAL